MMRFISFTAILLLLTSCSYYSFSGKSIPPHIKNAKLMLFDDSSGRYDLSLPELLNGKILGYIDEYNYFEHLDSEDADSRIFGTVRSYTENIVSQTRDEEIDQMQITLTLEVNFYDNKSSDFIVKNLRITETEYYEASGGDEARDEAFEKIIDRAAENTVLGLSSNW